MVESVLTPTEFRETLALVAFDHFDVPSLCFAPSHLLAIYTLGLDTALVIDAGNCAICRDSGNVFFFVRGFLVWINVGIT